MLINTKRSYWLRAGLSGLVFLVVLLPYQNCSPRMNPSTGATGSSSASSTSIGTAATPTPTPSASPSPSPSSACTYPNAWTTVDHYNAGDPAASVFSTSFASDALGNLYTVGSISSAQLIVRKSTDHGATWNTVETYSYPASGSNQAAGIAIDPSGNIYVVGNSETNGTLPFHFITIKSSDQGSTWKLVDDFQYSTYFYGANASRIGIDSLGNVFTTGLGFSLNGYCHYITRKSANQGTTWTTVDDYMYPGSTGVDNNAIGFGSDNLGNIYTAGIATDAAAAYHSIVRKSTDHGTSWTTVEDFQYTGGTSTSAVAFGSDPLGNIYSVGSALDASSIYHYLVRKSADHGTTWTTVDNFLYAGTMSAEPSSFGADRSGNIYTTGSAVSNGYGNTHYITRKSIDHGVTWTTVDDFVGTRNTAVSFGIDTIGNLFTVGFSSTVPKSGASYYTTRMLSCQ